MIIDQNTERLPCTLTAEEKDRKADELARELELHARLEFQKKLAAQSFDKQIKASDKRVAELGSDIRNGYEYREVRVAREKDFERNLVHTVRLDMEPGDPRRVVSSRPMEARERQAEMFAPTDPPPAAAKPADAVDAAIASGGKRRRKQPIVNMHEPLGPGDDDDDNDDDDDEGSAAQLEH